MRRPGDLHDTWVNINKRRAVHAVRTLISEYVSRHAHMIQTIASRSRAYTR